MQTDDGLHLTYCTNIHPVSGWSEVRANLEEYVPELKRRLAPDRRFGIGLRLSNAEARELLEADALSEFRSFLDRHGAYVVTINGFPYGEFHGESVKEDVHRPDWRTDERVDYTKSLADILAELAAPDSEPGISTNPLTYRHWKGVGDEAARRTMVENLVEVVEHLARIEDEGGPTIHVDIEPEPDGLLETTAEAVAFFEDVMFETGAELLAERTGLSSERGGAAIRRHLRLCLDTCHAAVQFESAPELVDRLAEADIGVGKIQVSSALDVSLPESPERREPIARELAPFDEPVYLHQVVQRNRDGSIEAFRDLGPALEAIDRPEAERWRIHFHVPIYRDVFGRLGSTQSMIVDIFDELERRSFTDQLEIETYTWDVLPDDEKLDLVDSIEREYQWVRDVLS